MKRLSEFEEMIRECKPVHFVFLNKDQESFDPFEPCTIQLNFSEVFVDLAGQSVFAKNENAFMNIDRIVGVDEEYSALGRIVVFRCGGEYWNTKNYSYKFLVV